MGMFSFSLARVFPTTIVTFKFSDTVILRNAGFSAVGVTVTVAFLWSFCPKRQSWSSLPDLPFPPQQPVVAADRVGCGEFLSSAFTIVALSQVKKLANLAVVT